MFAVVRIFVAASIALFLTDGVNAQQGGSLPAKADLATLNCHSIFNMNRSSTLIVLAWLQRHYAPRDAAPIVDSDKMMTDALKMQQYCEANPAKTVMEAASELFGARR